MANVGTAAAGKTLIGAGNGVSPTFASIGTNSGLAIHGVVLSQNNSPFTAAGPAAVGTVLMSNGAGADPSFQSGGTIFGNTITGNSGGAISPTAGNWNLVTADSTVTFVGSGSTITQDFGITNILFGSSGASISGGTANNSVGNTALNAIVGGTANNAFGFAALNACISGSNNVAVGQSSLLQLTTGSNNTCIGQGTGTSYTSSESSNIIIGSGVTGTAAESGVIRIGNSGSATTCFVAGITGVTAAGAPTAVSSTGQLSSLGFGTSGQVLTSGGAGVSPTWVAPTAYAAGSFTPTVGSTGTPPTITYGVQRGLYSKTGRQVHVEILITFASYTAGTGNIEIQGLPFTSNTGNTFPVGSAVLSDVTFTGAYVCCTASSGTTVLNLSQVTSAAASGLLQSTAFNASSVIVLTLNYEATA